MANKKVKAFEYKGKRITFDFGDGNKMVNATEMAKAFNKMVGHFLALKGTKEYIKLLESRYRDSDNGQEVMRKIQGGTPELQGTWMDEKLALKFAAWLSPEFEMWVYDKIHDLITKGVVELESSQSRGLVARTLRLIAAQLEEQDKINEEVKIQLLETSDRIDEIEAKIITSNEDYYSISGFCSLHRIQCPLSKAKKWGAEAMKLSNKKGYDVERVHDPRFGEVGSYHIDVLKEVFKDKI